MLISEQLVFAQFERQFRFTNFGKRDGLMDNWIYCGLQDDLGYLWFGTASGMYQFEGHQFTKYESPIRESNFLLENVLQCMAKDSEGNLWLSSANALQWFNPRTRKFKSASLKDSLFRTLCQSYIKHIGMESNGDVWFCTFKNSLFRFQKEDSSFHFMADQFGIDKKKSLLACYPYGKHELFVCTTDGMYHIDRNAGSSKFVNYPNGNVAVTSYLNRNEIILSVHTDYLLVFDLITKKFNTFPWMHEYLKEYTPLCLIKNAEGTLYTAGYGLREIDIENQTSRHETMSHLGEFGLKVNKIVQMFFDREGNLWLCSHMGLAMLSWQNSQVKSMSILSSSGLALEPGMVCALNKHQYFIGTNYNGEIHLVDKIKGRIKGIRKNKNIDQPNGVYFKANGNIYASDDRAIYIYDDEKRIFKDIEIKDQFGRVPKEIFKVIQSDRGKVILASYYNGFYAWDGIDRQLQHVNRWEVDQILTDTSDNFILPILIDKQMKVTIISNRGLYEYDMNTGKGVRKAERLLPAKQLLNHHIGGVQTQDGHIWFSSFTNGLYEYWEDGGKEYLNNYDKNSGVGIHSNACYDIIHPSKSNYFWIFNSFGLLKFDLINKKVVSVLDKQRGLREDVFGYYKYLNEDEDLLMTYYGAGDLIPLGGFQWDTIVPQLCFNSIKVNGQEHIRQWGLQQYRIEVPYDKNYIEMSWAALHYNNSNQIEYLYQLDSKVDEWLSLGNKPQLSIGGLREGWHSIKISAVNCDGLDTKNPLIIQMNVRAPFWRQTWFGIILFFGMVGIFFAIYRFRIAQVRREAKLKMDFAEQLSGIELRALRAQMNPHFIFNCLNSIQKYILKNDQYHASQYLTKFSRLIRLILDQSNQNFILMQSELELLQLYVEMEQLRFDHAFKFNVQINENVDPVGMEIPSMLIQPYIENAIWHGLLHKEDGPGKIVLLIDRANGHLSVVIEDNGVGRQKANELRSKQVLKKKSYGMKITEDRIAIFNAMHDQQATHQIEDLYEGSIATGTRVIINIPYNLLVNNKYNF